MGGSRREWEKVATGEGNNLQNSKDDVVGKMQQLAFDSEIQE